MARPIAQPNIVLIVCDQLRGDCLGAAGHPDVKTPYLDTLAAEGTLFENAYSACPSCIPARAGLLTGQAPSSHGRVGYQDGVDWEYDHYLAEELGCAGYQTACVGKMHVHPPRLACGFQTLKLHDGYIGHYRHADTPYWQHQAVSDDYMRDMRDRLGASFDVNGSGVENNSWITHPWIYEERYHPTNWVVDESIRFLETRDRTRPFFLTASFVRRIRHSMPPRATLTSMTGATCVRLLRETGTTSRRPSATAWSSTAFTVVAMRSFVVRRWQGTMHASRTSTIR